AAARAPARGGAGRGRGRGAAAVRPARLRRRGRTRAGRGRGGAAARRRRSRGGRVLPAGARPLPRPDGGVRRGRGRPADRGAPGRGPPGPAPLRRGPQAPGDRRRDALTGRVSPLVVSRRRPPRAGDGAYAPTGGRPMPDGGPAAEVDGLCKTFGDVDAVRGIEYTVRPGGIYGFHSPNGPGKFTTISMLSMLPRPTG